MRRFPAVSSLVLSGLVVTTLASPPVQAQTVEYCRKFDISTRRLECYDAIPLTQASPASAAAVPVQPAAPTPAPPASSTATAAPTIPPVAPAASLQGKAGSATSVPSMPASQPQAPAPAISSSAISGPAISGPAVASAKAADGTQFMPTPPGTGVRTASGPACVDVPALAEMIKALRASDRKWVDSLKNCAFTTPGLKAAVLDPGQSAHRVRIWAKDGKNAVLYTPTWNVFGYK